MRMLWLQYGGTDGEDRLFWFKMILIAAVHPAALVVAFRTVPPTRALRWQIRPWHDSVKTEASWQFRSLTSRLFGNQRRLAKSIPRRAELTLAGQRCGQNLFFRPRGADQLQTHRHRRCIQSDRYGHGA